MTNDRGGGGGEGGVPFESFMPLTLVSHGLWS